jgi:hypothetical protein
MKPFALAAIAAFALAAPVSATVLPVNGGWQNDTLNVAGEPTENSDWTVTFASPGHVWVLDCCIVGDVYTLSGDIAGSTSFYVGGPLHPTLDPLAPWADARYSKLKKYVAAGSYTFSITGDGAGGLPAGLYVAATTGAVPEPATWAMLIAGFGMVGAAMRRRAAVRSVQS